ncbi:enoyl-CoA hydratase/isomerase family protein [Calditrichota bacterium]
MINIKIQNEVAIFKLKRGITNAINKDLIVELAAQLDNIKLDSKVKSLILTSHNDKFFSIGFDIPELLKYSKVEFSEFFHSFNQLCMQLYTFPKPTFAAITGHATAGGCILAICCDYRYIADGRKFMGLNEIKLGVPLPYPTYIILKELVGARFSRDISDSGDFYLPEKLLEMGMVDDILPAHQVISTAIDKAKIMSSYPSNGFELIKKDRVEMVEQQINQKLTEKEKIFVDQWYSDDVRKTLKEAAKKF